MIRESLSVVLCLFLLAGCAGSSSDSTSSVDYSKEGPDGPNAATEFTKTASGLEYRILRDGTGAKPDASNKVVVSYRGWLDNGQEFDSSYSRGSTIDFPLQGVIAGWTEGLQLIGEGGKIELSIPSELGYGAQGAGPDIPPNAQLHFIVELHEVR